VRADPVVVGTRGGESGPRAPDANDVATDTGVDEVNPVSYLPAAFTTLFFLAASLLLGLIH
jgi:hypothetical protein